MTAPLSVAALISASRHPVSGASRACRGDAIAMALGRSLVGDALRVVHAGAEQEPSLQDYLAFGARNIEVLPINVDGDATAALAHHLKNVDIILTGVRAEVGAGSGLLPYLLAKALERPIIANVLEAKIVTSAASSVEVEIRQFLPKGQRRRVACPLPLVIAVHPLSPVKLTYAYARRLSGRIEAVSGVTATEGMTNPSWTVEKTARRPVKLKAQDKKSGHARLLSAIVSETKGGAVAFEGTTVDKAQVVLNYLREHRLVDF
jgi:N,N-dimethylglycine/sarcosine catabolism electron transfer flavoprotein subunit beta